VSHSLRVRIGYLWTWMDWVSHIQLWSMLSSATFVTPVPPHKFVYLLTHLCSVRACVLALRELEKAGASEKVREKASGALWILENRDLPQNRPNSAAKRTRLYHNASVNSRCGFKPFKGGVWAAAVPYWFRFLFKKSRIFMYKKHIVRRVHLR